MYSKIKNTLVSLTVALSLVSMCAALGAATQPPVGKVIVHPPHFLKAHPTQAPQVVVVLKEKS